MKIIKRGKYADKVYKCENCGCEFEINYLDINIERFDMVGGYYNIVGEIYCPECNNKIKIIDERRLYNDTNNNN